MSNYPTYQTYDGGHIDEDGYVWISVNDDIINVTGHRLSTGAMKFPEHKDVAECGLRNCRYKRTIIYWFINA